MSYKSFDTNERCQSLTNLLEINRTYFSSKETSINDVTKLLTILETPIYQYTIVTKYYIPNPLRPLGHLWTIPKIIISLLLYEIVSNLHRIEHSWTQVKNKLNVRSDIKSVVYLIIQNDLAFHFEFIRLLNMKMLHKVALVLYWIDLLIRSHHSRPL